MTSESNPTPDPLEPLPSGEGVSVPPELKSGEKRAVPRMLEIHRQEGIDFRRIVFLLLKRIWIIAIIMILGTVALIRLFGGKPRVYESEALINVASAEEKVLKVENVTQEAPGTPEYINTVVQALTGRNVLLRVIKSNHLENNPRFFPRKINGGNYSEDQMCDILSSHYRIFPQKGTRIIQILGRDTDPQMACTLASSLVKQFILESYQQRSSASKVANEFLSDEAAKLKEKLQVSEAALQRYKEEHNAVSLEQNQNIIVEKLRQVAGSVTQAQDARLKIEADLEQYRRTDPSKTQDLLNITSIASLPQVAECRNKLILAESEFETLKQRYMYRHPLYIAEQAKIAGLKAELRQALNNAGGELQNQYEKATETENKLQASLKEQEQRSLELSKLAIPYNVLVREVESDTALYQSVVSRMKETGVKAGEETSPLSVIEEPLVSSSPMPDASFRYILVGVILLLGGSIAGVLIHDRLSSSIRSVDEAEALLELPVLGSIPDEKLPSDTEDPLDDTPSDTEDPLLRGKRRRSRRRPKHYPVTLVDNPNSSMAESYRTLRTSLMLLDAKLDTHTLLLTSAIPAEGKTFCSVNVAASFALLGKKTLLIDADLRRPALHHALLGSEERVGLSDYLAGQATLEEVIVPTRVPNLFLITAGNRSPIPAELLADAKADALFKELPNTFDRVIVDSAPIHAVSDALILASKIKVVAVVIKTESTARHAILRAIHLLRDTDAEIAGVILNRMKRSGAGYYYYYYYGGKYSEYRNSSGDGGRKRNKQRY